MLIRGVEMDIDVREHLEPYLDMFRRLTDKGTHYNSCSPFRSDNNPSFYVYLEDTNSARAGYWGDHAADDEEFVRGTFLKLLAFLRNETEYETFEYLNMLYGSDAPADLDRLGLRPKRAMTEFGKDVTASHTALRKRYDETCRKDYTEAMAYMHGRHISEKGFEQSVLGQSGNALAIPWFNGRGELITVKFRDMSKKKFWYIDGGRDITDELFGIDAIYGRHIQRLYIVESEIDAIYLRSLGYDCVALGNKAMTRKRAEVLLKSKFDELCIIPDNDEPGMFVAQSIVNFMRTSVNIFIVELYEGTKDINDYEPDEVAGVLATAEQLNPLETNLEFRG